MTIYWKGILLHEAALKYGYEVINAEKSSRIHLKTNYETRATIARESFALNMTNGEYITLSILAFDLNSEAIKTTLKEASKKLGKYMKQNKIKSTATKRSYTGSTVATNETRDNKMAKKGRPTGEIKESVHIRLTPAAHDIVREKAAAMGISISDYVEFVITNFDIVGISESVEELSRKIDTLIADKEQKDT